MKDLKAREFIADFISLCKKYDLALTPSMSFERDFHSGMLVTPLDADTIEYFERIHILSEIESDDED